jgi:hypothetical protein
MNDPTAQELERTREGDGVQHKMRHLLKFDQPVTYDQARAWLSRKGWLGYPR